jgi:peptidyl-prolyl cis-trans isomerase A (cyclophilin A)
MARGAGADTATSDFFILLNDQPSLDFEGRRFDDAQGAAAFGRVVAGMDVARREIARTNKKASRHCDAPLLH